MKKISSDKIVIGIIVILALVAVYIPFRQNITNYAFQTALALNKAFATVNLRVAATYNGKPVKPEFILIEDMTSPKTRGSRTDVESFNGSVRKIIKANWINMHFYGFDQNGKPQYEYVFLPHNYEITVISPEKGLIGSKTISIIPDKPFINERININMGKTNVKPAKSGGIHITESGGGYNVIEEYKESSPTLTKIANIHSVYGEQTQAIFNRGCIAYIQSVFRTGDEENLSSYSWEDGGSVAAYADRDFATGYVKNGTNQIVKADVVYSYTREKTVVYCSGGTYIYYRETIEPIKMQGSTTETYLPNSLPSEPVGNKLPVGSTPGARNDFFLYGINQYYFRPAVTVSFGVNSVGANISISLKAERHYKQGVDFRATVLSSNNGKTLYGFDNGTNWAEIFFVWRY